MQNNPYPGRNASPRPPVRNTKKKKKRLSAGYHLTVLILVVIIIGLIIALCAINKKPDKKKKPVTDGTETTAMEVTDDSGTITEITEPEETTVPEETAAPEPQIPEVTFKADLSEYEQYMNPQGDQRDAYLLLVNAWNTLDSSYLPDDLTDCVYTRKDRAAQKMRLYAEKANEAMIKELYANGFDQNGPGGYPVTIMSAYRDYNYQHTLFYDTYLPREMKAHPELTKEECEAIVETYSARPGTSEHQSGLCCDMHNLASADQIFQNQDAYAWLYENCWKFGFILRFPDGKTDITGIEFEPWHYRYVGRYHAYQIMSQGLCLEEYLGKTGDNK